MPVEKHSLLGSDFILSQRVMITWPVEIDAVASGFIKYWSIPRQTIFAYRRKLQVAITSGVGGCLKDYLLSVRGRHAPKQRRRHKQVG
jgi:hypothetical protein